MECPIWKRSTASPDSLKRRRSIKFKKYVISRQCEEDLSFWMEVELLRKLDATQPKLLTQRIQNIYEQFIQDGATFQVNLDANVVRSMESKLIEQSDATLFNDAQRQ